MKKAIWWAIGIGWLVSIVVLNPRTNPWHSEHEQKAARDAEWQHEEEKRKQFDNDFAFLKDLLVRRDMAIYELAEKHDKAIIGIIDKTPIDESDLFIVNLKEDLKNAAIHHMEDCIRMQSRLREQRSEFSFASIPWVAFEIYDTKCDCECCRKD